MLQKIRDQLIFICKRKNVKIKLLFLLNGPIPSGRYIGCLPLTNTVKLEFFKT